MVTLIEPCRLRFAIIISVVHLLERNIEYTWAQQQKIDRKKKVVISSHEH